MKYLFTTLFLSSYSLFLYGQGKNASFGDKYFVSEFHFSINSSRLTNINTKHNLGFGVSTYRIWNEKKKINPVFGLEYNMTRTFAEYLYTSHFSNSKNVQFTVHCASFPLGLRFCLGEKIKFFIEPGFYFEVGKKREAGIVYSYAPYQQNQTWVVNYQTSSFNIKSSASNYGIYFGAGVRIPAKRNEVVIKTDLKFGVLPLLSYMEYVSSSYIRLSIGYKIW